MKIFSAILLGLPIFILPTLSFAQIYECKINGKTVFQGKPCVMKTVEQEKPQLRHNIQSVTDLSKIHLETHSMAFSSCKSEVLKLQSLATQQAFKTLVLSNTATLYNVKVCMPPNSSILMTCDGMKRKLFLRRRAPCN